MRVAIIGGGPTGLALAYFLGRTGWTTTIIEKGPALSGLLTFTTVDGVPIERFYHHFFTHDQYLLDLLGELGLTDRIVWREGRSAIYAEGHLSPFITKLDYLRLPFLSWATKVRGAIAAIRLRRQSVEKIPASITSIEYLHKLFGQSGWEKMWRPLLVNKFGDDADRISAQWIAKRIEVRSKSERHGREVLGYLDGSYRVLFDGLRQAIERQGGTIELNTEVATISPDAAGQFQINGQAYDIVVSTVAPNIIKKIVPALDLQPIAYRGAICPIFVLRSPITPYYWINILDLNLPFSVIVNQQALLPKDYYHGQWPLYIGHYVAETSELFSKSDAELAEYYLGYLRQIWPAIDQEIIRYEIGRAKNTQPVVIAPWTPLQHTTNIPNLYVTSMAHIFPEDRGVNYAIREARRITELLGNAAEETSSVREMHA